jgi:hypothetical protein
MVDTWTDADSEYFEDLLQIFDEHPDWEYDDRIDRADASERAADRIQGGGREEFNFSHSDTGATLYVGIPGLTQESPRAVSGTLLQGITDPDFEESDRLVSELTATQEAIARRNTEDERYTGPDTHADAGAIATIQAPFDYNEEDLYAALDTLSAVSGEVDEMHSDLFEELERYQ